jgi:periplasmic protein TonB
VAPPEVPRQLSSPLPPEQAATALQAPAAVEPVPGERPLPSSETVRSAAVGAVPTSAAEDRASAPPQVSRATAVPRAARHIENVNYLRAPVLEYPSASRRFGEQGRVVLRVLIGPDGHAEKIELHEASAFQRLNEAAMEAARRALYKPYTEDGVAQSAWALVALSFQLRR